MTRQNTNALQHAEQLLRQDRKQEARAVLMEYLRQSPSNARAWWLLSFALTDLKQQVECVERILQLDPGNIPARNRLLALKGELAPARREPSSSQPITAPFFPEDAAAISSTPPSQPAPPSPQPVSPFLTEEEPDSRPALTAFERSFPRSETRPPPPEPAPFFPETETSPRQIQPPPKKKSTAKKNKGWIKYAILVGVFFCAFISILIGFVIVLNNQRKVNPSPANLLPTDTPTPISTQGLPPTWTPAPTNTLFPTSTLAAIPTPTPVFNQVGTPDPDAGTGLSLGMQAPDFTLKNANTGNQVSLSDYKGRPVIVFFWADGCVYCDIEAETIRDIYTQYKNAGLVILAVDVWGDSDQARDYRDDHSLTYPMLVDPKGSVYKLYGGNNWFPLTYIMDAGGNVSYRQIGVMDYSTLNIKARGLLNLIPTTAP